MRKGLTLNKIYGNQIIGYDSLLLGALSYGIAGRSWPLFWSALASISRSNSECATSCQSKSFI